MAMNPGRLLAYCFFGALGELIIIFVAVAMGIVIANGAMTQAEWIMGIGAAMMGVMSRTIAERLKP